ncbi:MAG: CDP-diacylglycerol--glycerol-3-phosphate 3-phosphatidyltransferase [Pseudomonadota bacterium]
MWTVPNILTLARIGAIPLVIAGLMVGGDTFRWVACGVFVAACLTDFFDGYLARVLEQQSEFGRFLDPIADKLLVAALLLVLTASGEISGLSVIAAVIILCREIMVSGLREFLAGRQVTVHVSRLAKWKTTIQLVALAILVVGPAGQGILNMLGLGSVDVVTIGIAALWVAAVLTLITGAQYLAAGIPQIGRVEELEELRPSAKGQTVPQSAPQTVSQPQTAPPSREASV